MKMGHKVIFKRLCSAAMVVAMLLTLIVPVGAEENDGNVTFMQVDDSRVTATLPGEKADNEETETVIYEDDEPVRVSIVLADPSVLERGYSAVNIADNGAAMSYRQRLLDNQNTVTKEIEYSLGEPLDVEWNLTLAANLISANVEYGQIEEIGQIDGVKEVVIEMQYYPAVMEDVEQLTPQMLISTNMTGMNKVQTSGYTGAGSRIAIIDTGLDPDHQSFAEAGYVYALEQDAAAAGMSLEEYKSTLNLLGSEELAQKFNRTNAYSKMKKLTLSDLRVSEKVPFGFNYVDADLNISHDYDKQTDHGSHVAGIAAANRYIKEANGTYVNAAEKYKVVGNAPDAQLIVMKVFGVTGGGMDSDIVAACEDAILLGADSLNLSLGSTVNGFSASSTYAHIMETLESSVSVMAVAAANDGHWADHANTEAYLGSGYLYTEDVMYDRVASPGSLTNSMAVASVDNIGQISDAFFTVIGTDGSEYSAVYSETLYNDMKEFTTLDKSGDGKGTEYEFVFIDGLGYEEEFTFIDLEGKIAVISRGELAFYEKAINAVNCGAIATIIYNNTSGTLGMDLTSYPHEQPCISVTQEVGAKIRSMAEQQTAYDNSIYYTGKMKVIGSVTVMGGSEPNYTMSYFSSWGTTGDLSLKPEITAPGGGIYSVRGDTAATNKYKVNSGTSMATPQIAGVVAAFKEYIRENDLVNKFGFTERQLTQSLMMSTAVPMKDGNGNYYPVLQQGAGLVNGEAMVASSSVIMMNPDATMSWADGKVKAELGDDPDKTGKYSFSFTVYNGANADQTYQLSADLFSQDYFEREANINSEFTAYYTKKSTHKLESCAVFKNDGNELDGGKITVKAGSSAVIAVELSLDSSAKKWLAEYFPLGAYMQGYVFVDPLTYGEGINEAAHSIPVLAFYGNWTDPSMFDGPSTYEGEIITNYSTPSTTDNSRMAYVEDYQALATTGIANVPIYGYNHVTITANGRTYAFGGNPLVRDEKYMPERDAISQNIYVKEFSYVGMRDYASLEYGVRNVTTGESLFKMNYGNSVGSYYSKSAGVWQNMRPGWRFNFLIPEQNDGDIVEIYLTTLPEYYSAGKKGENSVPGDGATLKISGPIDETAPVVSDITYNADGTLSVTAADSNYIAAVVLYNSDGTKVVSYIGAKQEIEKGESAVYTVDTAGNKDNKFLLQVYDYAMNPATYYMEIEREDITYSGSILAYDLETEIWVQLSKLSDKIPAVTKAVRKYTAATSVGDTIYAVAYGTELYKLSVRDPETPEFIKKLPFTPVDLAYNVADGKVYAVTDEGKLVRIEPKNGSHRVIGATPIQTNTLACDENGVFYSNLYDTGKIYSYTLDAVKAADLSYDFDGDETFSEADCRVLLDYVIGKRTSIENLANADLDSDGDIDTADVRCALDKMSGRAVLIADNGLRSKYMQSMEFDPNDGTLYWSSYSTEYIGENEIGFSVLYGFDVLTGEYVRYDDVWHQMSCLLVLDKDAGSIYEPPDGSAGLDGAEDKIYTGATEQGGIAVDCGVDNSLKEEYLKNLTAEKKITVELTSDDNTYNALYTVSYDPALMTLDSYVGCGELNGFAEEEGKVTFGCAGTTAVLAGDTIAELNFTTTSCEADAVICVFEENDTNPKTETTVDTGNHRWGEWTETAATCCEDGSRSRECELCETVDTEIIAADGESHKWCDWVVVNVSNANAPGLQKRNCELCQMLEQRWVTADSVTFTAVDVNTGTITINEKMIAEARIYNAGVNKAWRMTTADGSIRYMVELSAETNADDIVNIRLAQSEISGSGAGYAIRKEKADSILWESNELDYTVALQGGTGSMTAYSYYDQTSYTELDIYFTVGTEGSENGEVTYISTPATSAGNLDSPLIQIGIWEPEVTKYYWETTTDSASKALVYDCYVWLAPELADDFELYLEFNGTNAIYRRDNNGAAIGSNLVSTGMQVQLENGKTTVKLVQSSYSSKRYFNIHLRNYTNYAPILAGESGGSINAVVGYSTFVDLDQFFYDFNGDAMTYTLSVNGREPYAVSNPCQLQPSSTGTLTLAFTANDGFLSSEEAYTMTVNVVNIGDVNADGSVNEDDAVQLRKYLAGCVDEAFADAGDVNADGEVNLTDYIILRRYIADWDGVNLGAVG